MRKIWLLLAIIAVIAASDCRAQIETSTNSNIKFASETADAWTPTLQLCWNELIDYVGGEKITYLNGNPPLADELNKQKFFKDDLSDEDYHISVGKMTVAHKNKIAEAIANKFNETSDILDDFPFEDIPDEESNKWFIYSMLIKNFPFAAEYDILDPDNFNKDETAKYKYFGFKSNDDEDPTQKLNKSKMSEIFYANDEDFALKIEDKEGKEEMILYLTASEASFDDIYNEILRKAKNKEEYLQERIKKEKERIRKEMEQEEKDYELFGMPDFKTVETHTYYKIPYLHIDEKFDFTEDLAGDILSNNGIMTIEKAVQTIKFDLDNKGARLKSEAGMGLTYGIENNVPIDINNYYFFDRPFVIFLKEADKDKPYFAARIKDGKYLVKSEDNNETERKEETSNKPMSEDEIMALFN